MTMFQLITDIVRGALTFVLCLAARVAGGISIAYGKSGRYWLWHLCVGMFKGVALAAVVLIVLSVVAALVG